MRRIMIVLATVAAVVVLTMGTASAQQYPTETPEEPEVLDESVNLPPQTNEQALPSSTTLPVTGGDVIGLTIIGLGAIALGGGLVVYRRRLS